MNLLGKISPIQLIGGGLLLYLAITQGSRNLGDYTTQAQIIGTQRKAAQLEQAQLLTAQEKAKAQDAIALERYKAGCVMVFAPQSDGITPTNQFAGIIEGKPVMDGNRPGVALSDGVQVCDSNGLTGVIANRVVTQTAFTSDRQVVADAMRRFGYDSGDAQYNAPKQ
jgi:hypothetical protein